MRIAEAARQLESFQPRAARTNNQAAKLFTASASVG